MTDLFTVVAINDYYNSLSGLALRAGQQFTARMGNRAGHYHILVNGEWFCVNADQFSVVR